MNISYKNRYGRLEIEVIGQYKNVSTISSKEIDDVHFFSIDDAEKIALITDNRGIQIAFPPQNLKRAYLLHHQSGSTAAVCKVVSLDFDKNTDARKELARPNPYFLV